jgi:hypothetical protein
VPRSHHRVNPGEWTIVLLMAAVIVSLLLPALQQGRRRAQLSRRGSPVASHRPTSGTAGQSNTIRLPDASSGSPAPEQPARRRGPSAGGAPQWGLVPLLLIVMAVIVRLLRRSAGRQARRRPRHPHEGA